MKHSVRVILVTGAALLGASLPARARPGTPVDDPVAGKAKYSIAQVMKALHKGEDSIGKRVGRGQGTKEDFAKLVEYYESLPLNEPPEGGSASWKKKSTALLVSAKALNEGREGALAAYKQAVDCKACHEVHRPE